MAKVQRNTSIELMRLLSMIMIVIHHIVGQGIGFQFYCGGGKIDYVNDWTLIVFIESFCIVGVNLFLLISGYYGIKLRMKGLIKFLSIVFGFVLLHSVCESFYNNDVTLKHILRSIVFFYSGNSAWFVKAYFILMLSTFVINSALEHMNKQQVLTLLGIVLYVNVYLGFIKHWTINENGFTVSHMIMMYVIGYMVKILDIPSKLRRSSFLLCYIFLSFLLGITMYLGLGRISNEKELWLLSYNNPVIIFSSISLFCLFVKCQFYNKKLNYILSGVFGIYLLHQYRPFWIQVMVPNIKEHFILTSTSTFVFYCIMVVIFILIIGIGINLGIMRIVNIILNNQFCLSMINRIDRKLGLCQERES